MHLFDAECEKAENGECLKKRFGGRIFLTIQGTLMEKSVLL